MRRSFIFAVQRYIFFQQLPNFLYLFFIKYEILWKIASKSRIFKHFA